MYVYSYYHNTRQKYNRHKEETVKSRNICGQMLKVEQNKTKKEKERREVTVIRVWGGRGRPRGGGSLKLVSSENIISHLSRLRFTI